MKDNLHLILITRNQSSQLFRSKAHNFVVVCDSYQQASERIQEYLDSEYIPFDKQSLYNDWLEDQIWFTDNINEDFHEKHNIDGELFKKYYSDYYFDKPKGYKTETGSLVDVSYDENGLVTGYSYDTKLCYYDNIELDSMVYDFLMDKYKTYEIQNLFNDYINLANISGLHKTDIIAYLNTESVEYYMQDVYSDIIDEECNDIQELTVSEFEKLEKFKEGAADRLNEDIKNNPELRDFLGIKENSSTVFVNSELFYNNIIDEDIDNLPHHNQD